MGVNRFDSVVEVEDVEVCLHEVVKLECRGDVVRIACLKCTKRSDAPDNCGSELAIKTCDVSTYVASLDDAQIETKRWRYAGGSKYPSIHKNLPYTDSKAGVSVSLLTTKPQKCDCDEDPAVGDSDACQSNLGEANGPDIKNSRKIKDKYEKDGSTRSSGVTSVTIKPENSRINDVPEEVLNVSGNLIDTRQGTSVKDMTDKDGSASSSGVMGVTVEPKQFRTDMKDTVPEEDSPTETVFAD